MSQANDVIVVAAQKCLSSQGRNRPKPAKNGLKRPTFRLIPRRNESIPRQNESVSSRCQSIPSRSPSIPRRCASISSRSQSISHGNQPRFPHCESTSPSFESAWPQCLPASQTNQSCVECHSEMCGNDADDAQASHAIVAAVLHQPSSCGWGRVFEPPAFVALKPLGAVDDARPQPPRCPLASRFPQESTFGSRITAIRSHGCDDSRPILLSTSRVSLSFRKESHPRSHSGSQFQISVARHNGHPHLCL